MSHVAQVECHVTSLEDLDAACKRLGLVLERGKQNYRWYGYSVGDYPLPEGFAKEDLGKCEHVVRLTDQDAAEATRQHGAAPYEVGVVRRRDGKPGFTLMWDFYCGGFGLQEKVGENCAKLKQAYAIAAATRTARAQGFRVVEQVASNGSVQLVCNR